jgi:hypothetical protein
MFHDAALIPIVDRIVRFLAGIVVLPGQETEALDDGHFRAGLPPHVRWLGKPDARNNNQASGQWL